MLNSITQSTMPRQRIYHTDEERAAANRAKGLRSYHRYVFSCSPVFGVLLRRFSQKFCSNMCPKTWSIRTTDETRAWACKLGRDWSVKVCVPLTTADLFMCCLRSNKGRKWTDELDDYHARFVRLSRPSPQQSLEQLYSKLIKAYSTGGLKLLEQQIQSFEALHQELRELENKILRSFGCGKELQIWQAVAKPVLRMLHCLQDIWCTYMGGLDDLKSVHKSNGFLYQK